MSSRHKNLSSRSGKSPSSRNMRFGIVVSEWNDAITSSLLKGCHDTLVKNGTPESSIHVIRVPGSYELTAGAQLLLEKHKPDAVICLGCVIQGETPHFHYICSAVAQGIMNLNIQYKKPVIFGVLTTLNLQQAKDRSGGKHGNKGDEAAYTAIQMAALRSKKTR